MKKIFKSLIIGSLISLSPLMAYEYIKSYDEPKKLELHNGNIDHQKFMQINSGYIFKGNSHINSSDKDGKYVLFEQDWQVKDGEQFKIYMKFIKASERYSTDPYKYILTKTLEIYYDTNFMYMQYDGFKKRFEVNPTMIKDFRKYNSDIDLISNHLFIQRDFVIGNLHLNMKIK